MNKKLDKEVYATNQQALIRELNMIHKSIDRLGDKFNNALIGSTKNITKTDRN